jgi:hypothetical protein
MLAPRLAPLALVAFLLAACAKTPDHPSPDAWLCAELVSHYLQQPSPIELARHENTPGRVHIEYRSGEQEGVALCQLRTREDGGFEVTGALVDENRLRDDELAAFEAGR